MSKEYQVLEAKLNTTKLDMVDIQTDFSELSHRVYDVLDENKKLRRELRRIKEEHEVMKELLSKLSARQNSAIL